MRQSHTNCITLAEWLPVLLRWYPIAHALVVGDDDLPLQHLHTIEGGQGITIFKVGNPLKPPVRANSPSDSMHQPVQHLAGPGAVVYPWLIASHTGQASYHRASLPAHSGLLPSESLQCCWPNIKTVEQKTVNALSLDAAVHQSSRMALVSPAPPTPDWLWVNCMPSLQILQGATQALQNAQVVLARVVLHPASVDDAALPPLQQLLARRGFTLSGVQPERNPHMGTAVFVRDYAAAKQAETQAKLLEAQAKVELLQKNEQLTQVNNALEASLVQTREELTVTEAAHRTARTQIEKLRQEKAALAQTRDEAEQAKADLLAELLQVKAEHIDLLQKQEQLAQVHQALHAQAAQTSSALAHAQSALQAAQAAAAAAAEKAAQELGAQAEQLAQLHHEKTTLAQARDVLAKNHADLLRKSEHLANAHKALENDLRQKINELNQLQQRLQQLQAEQKAATYRQQLMDEELSKAEVQIGLINDLLLNEYEEACPHYDRHSVKHP